MEDRGRSCRGKKNNERLSGKFVLKITLNLGIYCRESVNYWDFPVHGQYINKKANPETFNPFPNKPWFFTGLQYRSFENTVGKREIALNEQFLLFPHCFLLFW